jgi:hypothetical protein
MKKPKKTWNPLPAWRNVEGAWQDVRSRMRSKNTGKEVVTGRTIFIAEERRAFLKKLIVAAAVTAVVSPTSFVLSCWGAQASQLANYIQFIGTGNGSTDDSSAFQAALNTASAQPNGGTVFVPPCSASYILDNISLPSQVSIIGGDVRSVVFKAKSGSTNNMFVIPAGHVVNCRYENFTVNDNGNANQNCFMLQAVQRGTDGGMWWCTFRNLLIGNFSGYAMWFRGGPSGFVIPHQFIEIDHCIITRANGTYPRDLLLTGQCGQFEIHGGTNFDGNTTGTGTNIELGAEFFNSSAPAGQQYGGQSVGGSAVGSNCPYNIQFNMMTSQQTAKAVYIYNSVNIKFHQCYFENCYYSVTVVGASFNVICDSCHFTNAGADGASGGYCLSVQSSSFASLINCDFTGSYDYAVKNTTDTWGTFMKNNTYVSPPNVRFTSNYEGIINPSTTISTRYFSNVQLNSAGVTVTTITSLLGPGDPIEFFLPAANAAGGTIVFNTSGNILLGHYTTALTLSGNDVATFEWSDDAQKVTLRSTTGALS